MFRSSAWIVVGLALAACAVVALTSGELPDRVATHFGLGGRGNGWMSREGYLAVTCFTNGVLPLLVYLGVAWLPRRWPLMASLPMRDYWLAPERREATLAVLDGFGIAVALVTGGFMAGIHWCILDANRRNPPQLAEGAFFWLLGGFILALIVLVIPLKLRFRYRR